MKQEVDCEVYPECSICSDPVKDFPIAKKIKHPQYNRAKRLNDIALLKLAKDVTYSGNIFIMFSSSVIYTYIFLDYIRPICLPIEGIALSTFGDTMLSSGFARLQSKKVITERKKKIQCMLKTNKECYKKFKTEAKNVPSKDNSVAEEFMCTREFTNNSVHSCGKRDVGAPLMFSNRNQWHLEGIFVGNTNNKCDIKYPTLYVRVVKYLDWIEQNIESF